MHLPPGEPPAGPWRVLSLGDLAGLLLDATGQVTGRPRIVAVDGRSACGKSSLAARLRAHLPRSAIVHTDDLAWHEPLFGWEHLLGEEVLRPLREGRGLAYRPPQWDEHGRPGAIEIPAGLHAVIVEGVGASQREHADLVDTTLWVQADFAEAEARGIARDVADGVNGTPEETVAFWHDWMAQEMAFLDRQRPWQRAGVVVNGTPGRNLGPDHVEVAPPVGVVGATWHDHEGDEHADR